MARNPGRRSQQTSPGMDQWDIQLGQQLGTMMPAGSAANTTNTTPARQLGGGRATLSVNANANAPLSPGMAPSCAPVAADNGNFARQRRFIQEQMIQAGVSAMIMVGVHVSPGLIANLHRRSEHELTETLNTINQLVQDAQLARSCPPATRVPSAGGGIEREIYFDPHLTENRDRWAYSQQARPQAPIAHARTPLVGQPSPAVPRFATPAAHAGAHATSNGYFTAAAADPDTTPAAAHASLRGSGTAAAASGLLLASGGGADAGAAQTLTVKPTPRRASYDPQRIPQYFHNNANVAQVRRACIARSASSAFSQHSTQSSTLTHNPQNASEEASFARCGSS